MATEIHNWPDIAEHFQGTLVLGNGASIVIHNGFNYSSLLDKARERSLITSTLDSLFKEMKSHDFELALHHVSIAESVNKALGIKDSKTHEAYQNIRDALIQTVRKIHPEHKDIKHHLKSVHKFMKRFKTVVSLNYDLLIYWALMLGNEETSGQGLDQFKDCLVDGHFSTECLRNETEKKQSTLVFYPHGNLALAVDPESGEFKIASSDGTPLLDKIVEIWKNKLCTPLFVAEGNSKQKLNAIGRHGYLTTVYNDVLRDLDGSVAIYGWSLGDSDMHLLEKICKGKSKIAVSVHKDGVDNVEAHCSEVEVQIKKVESNAEVVFYDAKSPSCWIHPSQVPVMPANR